MNKNLLDALSNWQEMPLDGQPRLIKTFTAGLNHATHLIQADSKQFVLKLFEQAEPGAITAQQWAANQGLAPRIIFANPRNDIILMDYVGSATITRSDINQNTLKLLATALRQLHDSPTSKLINDVGEFNLIKFCEIYLKQIETSDTVSPQIHKLLIPALNVFMQDETQFCICHNDLVTANCFLTGTAPQQNALFIDWEYAQLNNPWFDLAAIIYYFELRPDEVQEFLNYYQGGWATKVGTSIEVVSQISLLWGDMLWHLARGGWDAWPNLENKLADLRQLALRMEIAI